MGSYNRILKLFPQSNVLDKALYGMGEGYLMIHDCKNAKMAYEAVEKRYAKEKIGADARAKLATIAKKRPLRAAVSQILIHSALITPQLALCVAKVTGSFCA